MIEFALWTSLITLGLAFLINFIRLVYGPNLVDRLLAVDTLYINSLALLIVFGMLINSRVFFEIALLIALFGFFSTVVVCKYILRGDVIE